MGIKTQRENWIDVAKSIAMLLIIIGHVSSGLEGWWHFRWVYGVHVLMFFLLSGYTLKINCLTKEYINKKFSRLMKPYFITCFFVIMMDIVNCRMVHNDFTIAYVTRVIGRDLVRSFFSSGSLEYFGTIEVGSRIGAIWFLPAMFFAIILVQYVLNRIKNTKQQGIVLALLAMSAYLTKDFFWLPFSLQSAMMGAFFLWVGFTVKNTRILDRIKWYHFVLAQIVFIWGSIKGYTDVGIVKARLVDIFLSPIVGLCGCLIIALLSKKLDKAKILVYIGRNSLIVLCTHLFALETLDYYFRKLLDRLSLAGNARVWAFIGIEIIWAVAAASVIVELKRIIPSIKAKVIGIRNNRKWRDIETEQNRDVTIDVARGIFIITMIIGHFQIDSVLRGIIYSCHMVAFIFFSGYFYKTPKRIDRAIMKMVRSFLLPYVCCVGLSMLLNYSSWSPGYVKDIVIKYLVGMSFSKSILVGIPSVGPVYFILLLFITRLLYMLLDRVCPNDRILSVVVILITLMGVELGYRGLWLPWSIDVAMYGIVYYHIGVLFRRYHLLDRILSGSIVYFICSSIWAYMIYLGSMEIAVRRYGSFGLVVLGSISGILVIMQMSVFIKNKAHIFCTLLSLIGKYSLYIIIVHVLIRGIIGSTIGNSLNPEYVPFMALSIIIQLSVAIVVGICIDCLKRLLSERRFSLI